MLANQVYEGGMLRRGGPILAKSNIADPLLNTKTPARLGKIEGRDRMKDKREHGVFIFELSEKNQPGRMRSERNSSSYR